MTDLQLSEVTMVRRADLARILKLTDQTISNYSKSGMPSNGQKGNNLRFNLADCIEWVRDFEINKALKGQKSTQLDDSDDLERRMLLAKTTREEYKTAQLTGAMVTVEDADHAISTRLERIRGRLLAIPAVWGPQILGLKEIPDAVDQLSDLTTALMDELANAPAEDDEDESIGELPAPMDDELDDGSNASDV